MISGWFKTELREQRIREQDYKSEQSQTVGPR